MKISTEEIIVPEDRWDRDLSNTDGLKESIEEHGIIEPIVLSSGNLLVAGMRRLTFAKELGLATVPIVLLGDLTPYKRKCLELEENIRRKNLTWAETDVQTASLHKLKLQVEGQRKDGRYTDKEKGWSLENTAKLLGVSKASISQSMTISKALNNDPSLAEEKSRKLALSKIKRREIQEINKILAERASEETSDMFLIGDNKDLITGVESESIGMVLTDVPYDIQAEDFYNRFDGRLQYEDTRFDDKGTTQGVLDLRDELYRVLVPGSFLVMFCGQDQFFTLREHYGKKFNVRYLPVIWNKITRGFCPEPDRNIPFNYEQILIARKGFRLFNLNTPLGENWGDVWDCRKVSSSNKVGINEKPILLLQNIIRLCSNRKEVILDPYCGVGSTLVASVQLDRKGIGFDKNPEAIAVAKTRIEELNE